MNTKNVVPEKPSITFHYSESELPGIAPKKPVSILFLTSIRDIGTCDQNGRWITTDAGKVYMEGVIERTANDESDFFEIASVVCDDVVAKSSWNEHYGVADLISKFPEDTFDDLGSYSLEVIGTRHVIGMSGDYEHRDKVSSKWIHDGDCEAPYSSAVPNRAAGGEFFFRLNAITGNIGSYFRFRGLRKELGLTFKEAKLQFEQEILEIVKKRKADIIVSDHYMGKLEHLHHWLPGRVLNIHPAVTVAGHPYCFRGKTPTADAIARAKIEENVRTGATLHFVDDNIDEGPAIAYTCDTPVYGTDEPQWLRYRNYQNAKLPLFVEGMKHYIENIYPYLDTIDLSKLTPRNAFVL